MPIRNCRPKTKCSLLASGLVCRSTHPPQGSRHESEERPFRKVLQEILSPLASLRQRARQILHEVEEISKL